MVLWPRMWTSNPQHLFHPVFLTTGSSLLLSCDCSFFLGILQPMCLKLFSRYHFWPPNCQTSSSSSASCSLLIWSPCLALLTSYILKFFSLGFSAPVSPGSPFTSWLSPVYLLLAPCYLPSPLKCWCFLRFYCLPSFLFAQVVFAF